MVRVKYLGVKWPEEEMVRVLPTLDHLEKLNARCAPFSNQSIALGQAISALQKLSVDLTARPLRTRELQDTAGNKPAQPSIEMWAMKEHRRELARWETQKKEADLRGEPPPYHLRPNAIVLPPLTLPWMKEILD